MIAVITVKINQENMTKIKIFLITEAHEQILL